MTPEFERAWRDYLLMPNCFKWVFERIPSHDLRAILCPTVWILVNLMGISVIPLYGIWKCLLILDESLKEFWMDLKAIIKFERMWGKYRKEILDEKERRRAAWERRRKEQEELGEDDEL